MSIVYDYETREYAVYDDIELIAFAPTYRDGEVLLLQLAEARNSLAMGGMAVICQQPDNLCDVHNPCPAHAADAARYLAEHSYMLMPEGDVLDADGMRVSFDPPFDDPLLAQCAALLRRMLGGAPATNIIRDARALEQALAEYGW